MTKASERSRFRAVLHGMTCLAFGSVWLVAGCGESSTELSGSPEPSQTAPSTTPSSAAQAEPFVSQHYRYRVNAKNWIGTQAPSTWDGKSATGDGDPTVDVLYGPRVRRVWAVSAPTTHTLQASAVALRKTNAKAHPCPKTPEEIHTRRIDGEPAIVDATHCPPSGGVFALNAMVKHNGRIYLFFTYDQPGREAAMRIWFSELLDSVSFDV
jgi:hypothetical protein